MKVYTIQYNVGRCKYMVGFHDGIKKCNDGSRFFDIQLFSNKRKMQAFTNELVRNGYKAN